MSIHSRKIDELHLSNKYDKHVFVCINSRVNSNESSCGEQGFELREAIIEELSLHQHTNVKIRINKSGCLNECKFGPVVVIYPQGFWYYNVQLSDINEIIEKSIIEDYYIERLNKL